MAQQITIEVDSEAARVYRAASEEQRNKLNALLNLKLREYIQSDRTLEEIMSELSRKAQARGLTPAKLEEILKDE